MPEAAALALGLIFALTIWLGFRYVNQADLVRHTLEVQTKISRIWSHMQDAEIGQRSYVLTGEDRFLQPYYDANQHIWSDLDALAALTSDNPAQARAVTETRPLIGQRLAFANETIALRRRGDFDGAREKVLSGQGTEMMRNLRQRFERLRAAESDLLAAREAAAQSTIYALTGAIALGVIGMLGVLIGWIVHSRGTARALALTNAALVETIADREAAELQIRQMQKMEAVGQLTGGIAHDFNNMLAVIISGVGLAQKRLAKGEPGVDEFLSGAIEGAQRAATLVKRLLAFSRQQPLAPVSLDANKFVAGISELISRALGESIRMETILGGGLWLTHADSAQLENSILNLCVNARDAMPDGGRLTVETANCHLDDRYARQHPGVPAGQYVLIAVSDTGQGMTPDVLAKAFDPFFTTKDASKGTGLGLSQVFGFVKQSGGHVKIYSEPGQGTTVKIYLPRHYAPADNRPPANPILAELRGTESILLVEDELSVLTLTATSLRELGYTVLEATHANEAVRQLKNGARVDLLLTDIVMPDVNGRKLADQALALRPGLKVLFMTGFTKNAVVHNGVLDHGVHFLAKPFSIEELSRKVREAIETEIHA
ncbi:MULTISPECIES: CHASE3 domain-containing protein [Rhodomicrobium]|uniref:CHASE3 domain-containing protein n=1 Tax=Rhodomicrobium TaxID=1068 RepID=UPI001FD87F10|nr:MULTISPECIES: CHASE3 domain-containing protein [Rhodomicrobium]